ncbi:oxygenase MpaB family protein [Streptomyces sp. KR80]|uniref:oxygenase MpaB family protein n=1 Tax=Streptomyces sp. KR80 TaxID=3457426 RepID=UPI003FD4D742
MRRDHWLTRIADLDPLADAQEIYRISSGHEFPWDYLRALELALLRTFCVPSISGLLAATGEFEHRPQKRYDDTALLMAELAEHGYDSTRGKEALRVINGMHRQYSISNDDMLYVLSTFVYEPIYWIDEFGWRPLHPHERQAAFHYYGEIGRRMGIRDIPPDYAGFRDFKQRFEHERFDYCLANQAIGRYTINLFRSRYPRPLRSTAEAAVRSLLEQPTLSALGLSAAPAWAGRAVRAALRGRASVVRLLPPRRDAALTRSVHPRGYPGYPAGYCPADLGAGPPPADMDPHLLHRPARRPIRPGTDDHNR